MNLTQLCRRCKYNSNRKSNYRPVSIMSCISKIFEGILIDHLQNYFEPLMSAQMSGFRKGFNCQTVLTDFIERCTISRCLALHRCCID